MNLPPLSRYICAAPPLAVLSGGSRLRLEGQKKDPQKKRNEDLAKEMNTDMKKEKESLRQLLRARRDALPQEERKARDEKICAKILASAPFRSADLVLLYAPTGSEVDILPVAEAALREGKRIAFPKCAGAGVMHFLSVASLSDLLPGKYGIKAPPENAVPVVCTQATLCLTPGLAFDREGRRLGYGGGYYDRFLAGFPGTAAGVVPHDFMLAALPCAPHDRAVSILFSEEETCFCKTHS